MGFRINTNIAAMTALNNSTQTNLGLDKSLQALSSGLRINTAADDASGLAIANSLRAQSTGLGQAINNANDGIGVTQTADGALDEYENIINTVRTKSIQASSDGQNDDSRQAIQRDISKLLEEAQNIATTTSFNGQQLLDGTFQDKAFHIGAYKDEVVTMGISDTSINSIGQFAEQTGGTLAETLAADLTVNGIAIGETATDSAKVVADLINAANAGVEASATTTIVGGAIAGGTVADGDFTINGFSLGDINITAGDTSGTLVTAINSIQDQTGVTASVVDGKLNLTSSDGNDITINAAAGTDATAVLGGTALTTNGDSATLTAATPLVVSGALTLNSDNAITLGGTVAHYGLTGVSTIGLGNALSTIDVQTRDGAESAIQTADAALKQIDAIRSDIGSTQNQLESTIRNISVTQVNVAAAESQIRDVDFAAESATFAKYNILAQSGSYAMSQANSVQQNVLKLLQ